MKSTTGRFYLVIALMIFSGLLLSTNIAAQTLIQNDINGPAGSGEFGKHAAVLPNGNFVITDPKYSIPGGAVEVGAVYLYSRQGSLISTLTGSTEYDYVGFGGITVLASGNYVIMSQEWDNGAAANAGAATFGRMTTGVSGVVSSINSLIGSSSDDCIGDDVIALSNGNYVVKSDQWANGAGSDTAGAITLGSGNVGVNGVVSSSNSLVGVSAQDASLRDITLLSNGNYVVTSPSFNSGRGAATFGSATVPLTGEISSANSLVGGTVNDSVGNSITVLPNGNYVVFSRFWDNGTIVDTGAATFGNGTTGKSGIVSASNSIVGSSADDGSSMNVTALTNSNYVTTFREWDRGSIIDAGAAAFCGNPNGCSGSINSSNSLVGSTQSDSVGKTLVPLTNGNYVVGSPSWHNSGSDTVGAATFGNGINGAAGTISSSNSLIGEQNDDLVGLSIVALSNGNYVVGSLAWQRGTVDDAGAATFGNGNTGVSGVVSTSNSLVGSTASDAVGFKIMPLANGNYVVYSTSWDNGSITDAGAATFGNGTTGISGDISSANSLVGSSASDFVSVNNVAALPNGNYVVKSYLWSNVGAATFGNGIAGVIGTISSSNSLVGTTPNDRLGIDVTVLSDGNYLVGSTTWSNGATTSVGHVTYGDRTNGIAGVVSPTNSLVGSTLNDQIGGSANVVALPSGYYVVKSTLWDNGAIVNAGAISFSNTALTGEVNSTNSVIGTVAGDIDFQTSYSFDEIRKRLFVGRPKLNKVTRAQLSTDQTKSTKFDFDGDGKSDLSIFRPGPGEWWYLRSSDLVGRGFQFGASMDTLVPADFTGDGKTDIAFWRNGEWFVLRSEDSSFYSVPFGSAGDIPAPGDFDGDGMADTAVYRPSNQFWYIQKSSGGTTFQQFGVAEDKPTVADFDGDGKDDIAVYRPSVSQWWQFRSTDGVIGYQFGTTGDKTVQGDFTGDGKADVALFRPSDRNWYVLRSEDSSFYSVPFGLGTDIPVAGDYDGDGKFDTAVFRPSDNNWYVQGSTSGFFQIGFGITGDVPLPGVYSAP